MARLAASAACSALADVGDGGETCRVDAEGPLPLLGGDDAVLPPLVRDALASAAAVTSSGMARATMTLCTSSR